MKLFVIMCGLLQFGFLLLAETQSVVIDQNGKMYTPLAPTKNMSLPRVEGALQMMAGHSLGLYAIMGGKSGVHTLGTANTYT